MNENHKDTLHIESIQQLKKQESWFSWCFSGRR